MMIWIERVLVMKKVAADRNSLDPPPIKALRLLLIHLPVYNRYLDRSISLASSQCSAGSGYIADESDFLSTSSSERTIGSIMTVHYSGLGLLQIHRPQGVLVPTLVPQCSLVLTQAWVRAAHHPHQISSSFLWYVNIILRPGNCTNCTSKVRTFIPKNFSQQKLKSCRQRFIKILWMSPFRAPLVKVLSLQVRQRRGWRSWQVGVVPPSRDSAGFFSFCLPIRQLVAAHCPT